MTYWAIITRSPSSQWNRWYVGPHVYDTKALAIAAATAEWEGTSVTWRLMTIPGEED